MNWRCFFSPSLKGQVLLPGDKSISHRALIMAALAPGRSVIRHLGDGDDIKQTLGALRRLGINIVQISDRPTVHHIHGRPLGCLSEPDRPIFAGNSGTTARLLAGILSAQSFHTMVVGDGSLQRRPMGRVAVPLSRMGAEIRLRHQQFLPMMIKGFPDLIPFDGVMEVPSAQVKSALLLAGLHAEGRTKIIERVDTRDHTEKMLPLFGIDCDVKNCENEQKAIILHGRYDLRPCQLDIPGDPSSAAFMIVAALLSPDSHLVCRKICLNPQRIRYVHWLQSMGADIRVHVHGNSCGDPVGDIEVFSSRLCGVHIPSDQASLLIDEYPILAVAASRAHGKTTWRGLGELRYKESNRFNAILAMLDIVGCEYEVCGDDLTIEGFQECKHHQNDQEIFFDPKGDHRMTMAAMVLGCTSGQPMSIKKDHSIDVSFPSFVNTMQKLGANIVPNIVPNIVNG